MDVMREGGGREGGHTVGNKSVEQVGLVDELVFTRTVLDEIVDFFQDRVSFFYLLFVQFSYETCELRLGDEGESRERG